MKIRIKKYSSNADYYCIQYQTYFLGIFPRWVSIWEFYPQINAWNIILENYGRAKQRAEYFKSLDDIEMHNKAETDKSYKHKKIVENILKTRCPVEEEII